jgi:malate synthase
VPLAKSIFDTYMPFPNQIHRHKEASITPSDLLCTPSGTVTSAGLNRNLDVGLRYLAAWLAGNGCVPIHNLMEDAATAEICRAQVWQWLRHGAVMDDGQPVTPALVRERLELQADKLRDVLPEPHLSNAAKLYAELVADGGFPEFLTLRAYEYLA